MPERLPVALKQDMHQLIDQKSKILFIHCIKQKKSPKSI